MEVCKCCLLYPTSWEVPMMKKLWRWIAFCMLIIYRSFNAMEKLRRHVWRVVRKFWRASEFDECVFEFEVHRAVKRLCISKCLRTPGNSFLSSQHALSTDLSTKSQCKLMMKYLVDSNNSHHLSSLLCIYSWQTLWISRKVLQLLVTVLSKNGVFST